MSPKGLVHNLLMRSFTLGSSKIEVFQTCFFDIVATYNEHPSYVKHVLGRIYVLLKFRGRGGGGASKGWVHNLLLHFFTLDGSKIEVFETCFFDIVSA